MYHRFLYAFLFFVTLMVSTDSANAADPATKTGANPMVTLTTSHGDIVIELEEKKAPISVKNFLGYVDSGFFDGLIFHRVIPGFMIQGGGMTPDMQERDNKDPIKNEANNGLLNTRGTLAMARTQVVDSATSQFFINLADNDFLNNGKRDFGYAVFGRVIAGMDVVDKIAKVKTGNHKGHGDVPTEPVLIIKASRS